ERRSPVEDVQSDRNWRFRQRARCVIHYRTVTARRNVTPRARIAVAASAIPKPAFRLSYKSGSRRLVIFTNGARPSRQWYDRPKQNSLASRSDPPHRTWRRCRLVAYIGAPRFRPAKRLFRQLAASCASSGPPASNIIRLARRDGLRSTVIECDDMKYRPQEMHAFERGLRVVVGEDGAEERETQFRQLRAGSKAGCNLAKRRDQQSGKQYDPYYTQIEINLDEPVMSLIRTPPPHCPKLV